MNLDITTPPLRPASATLVNPSLTASTTNLPLCLPPHISAELFLATYWQKKPLLIKNGLPHLVGMFEPADIVELAQFDDVTARLITQTGKHHHQWTLQNSPFSDKDLANLPEQWTVLVQNMEQWSPELAQLWHAFDFIPQWQRDDIMVSFAPKGGSVGKHFDNYDVFLAQGFGERRWQLGKFCDDSTEFLIGQPIRIFDDMGEIIFDEILSAGDVLYVPPHLAHYGVAQNDCLTFSFGFRRPSLLQILDGLVAVATHDDRLNVPFLLHQTSQSAGKLTQESIADMRQNLLALLNSPQGETLISQAVFETVSKRQYDVLVSEVPMDFDELVEMLENGATITQDMASRILYQEQTDGTLLVYVNGEKILTTDDINTIDMKDTNTTEYGVPATALSLFAALADGATLNLAQIDAAGVSLESVADWVDNGWVLVNDSGE